MSEKPVTSKISITDSLTWVSTIFALTVHQLLRGQQHAQSCRGDVLDRPEVQTQLGDAVKVGPARFQLGAVVVSMRPSMANDSAESFFLSFLISMIFLLQKRLNFSVCGEGPRVSFSMIAVSSVTQARLFLNEKVNSAEKSVCGRRTTGLSRDAHGAPPGMKKKAPHTLYQNKMGRICGCFCGLP